jgi:hypothetical protein
MKEGEPIHGSPIDYSGREAIVGCKRLLAGKPNRCAASAAGRPTAIHKHKVVHFASSRFDTRIGQVTLRFCYAACQLFTASVADLWTPSALQCGIGRLRPQGWFPRPQPLRPRTNVDRTVQMTVRIRTQPASPSCARLPCRSQEGGKQTDLLTFALSILRVPNNSFRLSGSAPSASRERCNNIYGTKGQPASQYSLVIRNSWNMKKF